MTVKFLLATLAVAAKNRRLRSLKSHTSISLISHSFLQISAVLCEISSVICQITSVISQLIRGIYRISSAILENSAVTSRTASVILQISSAICRIASAIFQISLNIYQISSETALIIVRIRQVPRAISESSVGLDAACNLTPQLTIGPALPHLPLPFTNTLHLTKAHSPYLKRQSYGWP